MHVVDIARSHGMYLVWGEQTETIYEKTCDDPYIVTILQVANHFFIHILRQFFWAQRWRPPYHWWNQKRVYSPFKSMPQISILGKLDDISVISAFERKHMFFLFFDVYIRIYIWYYKQHVFPGETIIESLHFRAWTSSLRLPGIFDNGGDGWSLDRWYINVYDMDIYIYMGLLSNMDIFISHPFSIYGYGYMIYQCMLMHL